MAYQHLTTSRPSTIAALATVSGASHGQRLRSVPYSPEHYPRHQLLDLDLLLLVVPYLVPAFNMTETDHRIGRSRLQITVDATQTQCQNTINSDYTVHLC
jgi:hypothetical protein